MSRFFSDYVRITLDSTLLLEICYLLCEINNVHRSKTTKDVVPISHFNHVLKLYWLQALHDPDLFTGENLLATVSAVFGANEHRISLFLNAWTSEIPSTVPIELNIENER